MGMRLIRGTAAAVLFATAAFAGGCGGGGDDSNAALLAGAWSGTLGLSYQNGGGASGTLQLDLGQVDGFVSGSAVWAPVGPVGTTQSIAGPVEDAAFTLLLHFRCTNTLGKAQTEITTLTGAFDGAAMTITGASGAACPDGGAANTVSGASGSLTRLADDTPL